MFIFGSEKKARGCFFAIGYTLLFGKGAQLMLPDKSMLPLAKGDQSLVTGLRFTQMESYNLLRCFGGVTYTYAFGHDPSQSVAIVDFTAMMITADGTKVADVITNFNNAYGAARVSQSKAYAQIVIGSNVIKGFIVGISSGTADPHHNLQGFTITLLLVEPQSAQQGNGQQKGGDQQKVGSQQNQVVPPLVDFKGTPITSLTLTNFKGNAIGSDLATAASNAGSQISAWAKSAGTGKGWVQLKPNFKPTKW